MKSALIGRCSSLNYSSHVDPSEHFLEWAKPAVNVLVIKKVMDRDVTASFKELTFWLIEVSFAFKL